MKLFITRKKMIKEFAEEMAYLQVKADWWYYISSLKEKQEMSDSNLEQFDEVRCICHKLGILKQVYDEAYKIYDFRQSGEKDYKPDLELIKKLNKEFCEPIKKKRLVI